jgi:hypothetical protein
MNTILILFFIVVVAVTVYITRERFVGPVKDNNACILLTTTVNIKTTDYLNPYNQPASRLAIYKTAIDKWLANTDFTIYVVESSNYGFPEYRNNPRVKVFTFVSDLDINCKHCSATPYEAESILKAFNHFKLNRYQKIIKVTGKYYIPGMDKLIKDIPDTADLYFQNLHDDERKIQNSEIFGCRTSLLPTVMKLIIDNSYINMNFESTLYSIQSRYTIYRFPPIALETPIKRSGDNKIMDSL